MRKRRDFIKKLTAGMALPGLAAFGPAMDQAKQGIDHRLTGEAFWDQVRASFPLTHRRVYLNNGTFGPAPQVVQEALKSSLEEINTSGEYGSTAPERELLAAFLGIGTNELSLTHNTTEGINIMAWGVPLTSGDEVILTNQDHAGNALPWLNRAKIQGITLKAFTPAATAEENLHLIQSLTTAKTKVIAIPHVTCTTGLVFPIREISEFARERGILTAIDGAHGAGTFDLKPRELGCDFYAGCCHKWLLGPAGTGFLYVRAEAMDRLQPIHFGAGGDLGWDLFSSPPALEGYIEGAHRYDYGTQSTSLMKGVSAATAFHLEIGKEKIEARVRELNQHLLDGLLDLEGKIEILSPTEAASRISMLTFRPKSKDYQSVGKALGEAGFRIRQVPEGRTDGIRISTHIYNSKAEIDRLLQALPDALG
ncbi:aminotransferase class V-fold PLP-dependent enzyme [Algoriphagus sp. H41]|uniref:Aminotransferase class V-fold PLP-dependent enzyme n=1 Tax=Algoriphagus oliviformis TaxID=2811231 RepID=A0ABS3C5Y1_9BACT|nr:aminotransferase class V-fold PLP-dependent enzyme [Algoriphagus oliviformis]MBN7812518.1 aminotransferase class V-fold PLP-dependent enzyme [Algoriphagus oliviformis]